MSKHGNMNRKRFSSSVPPEVCPERDRSHPGRRGDGRRSDREGSPVQGKFPLEGCVRKGRVDGVLAGGGPGGVV